MHHAAQSDNIKLCDFIKTQNQSCWADYLSADTPAVYRDRIPNNVPALLPHILRGFTQSLWVSLRLYIEMDKDSLLPNPFIITKCGGSVTGIPVLYMGGLGLKFQPREQLCWKLRDFNQSLQAYIWDHALK